MPMSDKLEGTLALIAAVLVLFSAMLDPLVTVIVSASLMAAFAVYKLVKHRKAKREDQ